MNKIIYILSLTFLSLNILTGQCGFDNESFEDWSLINGLLISNDVTIENEIFLPDNATTVLRAFLMSFGAFFDPAIGQIFVDDPQGFFGMDQSSDASDGQFAVKLQGGYDLNDADLYSVTDCITVPDSFSVDIKHVGNTLDSLQILVVFDEGLNELPEDFSDVENFPAYALDFRTFDADTDYETITLPIIENFDASVDTAYYLIVATTHDDSHFLVDNINTFEEQTSSTQDIDVAQVFQVMQNPVQNELIIKISPDNTSIKTRVQILNLQGKILHTQSIGNSQDAIKVDVSQLYGGRYIVSLQSEHGVASQFFTKL